MIRTSCLLRERKGTLPYPSGSSCSKIVCVAVLRDLIKDCVHTSVAESNSSFFYSVCSKEFNSVDAMRLSLIIFVSPGS